MVRSSVMTPRSGSVSFFAVTRARTWMVSPILIGALNFHRSPPNAIVAYGRSIPRVTRSRSRVSLLLFLRRGRRSRRRFGVVLHLMRDDLFLDLVVRGLRDARLLDDLVLALVRPVVDDLLRVGVADPGQRLQLGLARRVDVELAALHGVLLVGGGLVRRLRRRLLGLGRLRHDVRRREQTRREN